MNIAILGLGARGHHYGMIAKNSGESNVVAVCDVRQERIELAKEAYGLPDDKLFLNEDDFFAQGKIADLCGIVRSAVELRHNN